MKIVPKIAVLFAAGRGSRLRPHTEKIPKPLLLYEGQPILNRMILALSDAGVHTVILVTNYLEQQIESATKTLSTMVQLHFVHQECLSGTATATAVAKPLVKSIALTSNEPVLLCATDYIVPAGFFQRAIAAFSTSDIDILVAARRLPREKIAASSIIQFDKRGNILSIIEKPTEYPDSAVLTAALIYIVPLAIFDVASQVARGRDGERPISDAVNKLLSMGYVGSTIDAQDVLDIDLFYSAK